MTEFLVNGHIREYYDNRELDEPLYRTLWRIRILMRECEKYNIDYDAYVDKSQLYIILDQLDCCIDNKDNKNIKKKED